MRINVQCVSFAMRFAAVSARSLGPTDHARCRARGNVCFELCVTALPAAFANASGYSREPRSQSRAYLGLPMSAPASPPALLAAIEHALQMAALLPRKEKVTVRVGVLSCDDTLLWTGSLRGLGQARFLRDQLRPLGFDEYLPLPGQTVAGCDWLLKQEPAAAEQERHEIVRSSVPRRWPPARR
jgi:hypothetical protein